MSYVESSTIYDLIYQLRVEQCLGDVFHHHDNDNHRLVFTFVSANCIMRNIYFYYMDGLIKVETTLFETTIGNTNVYPMKDWEVAIHSWCNVELAWLTDAQISRPNLTFEWPQRDH